MLGSSPLARGTSNACRANQRRRRRLIPARAGNISPCSLRVRSTPAHPRSRGEHLAVSWRPQRPVGSSPLARGTYEQLRDFYRATRLIPARAGNILSQTGRLRRATAHPRSRGEHFVFGAHYFFLSGSSPLARGTFLQYEPLAARLRLIPARAGNIAIAASCDFCTPAHPRSRGEHLFLALIEVIHLGSSPLARGTSHYSR